MFADGAFDPFCRVLGDVALLVGFELAFLIFFGGGWERMAFLVVMEELGAREREFEVESCVGGHDDGGRPLECRRWQEADFKPDLAGQQLVVKLKIK